MKKLSLAIMMTLSTWSRADSGWVGNSPMMLASYGAPSFRLGEPGIEGSSNSLLQRDGQVSLTAGLFFYGFDYGSFRTIRPAIARFQYGITDSLTWDNLTSFMYSLKGNGGIGSELALSFGIRDLVWQNSEGKQLFSWSPHIGVLHAWTQGDWRLSQNLQLTTAFADLAGTDWARGELSLTFGIDRKLGERWAIGLETSTGLVKSKGIEGLFWRNPSFGVNIERTVSDNASVAFSTRYLGGDTDRSNSFEIGPVLNLKF